MEGWRTADLKYQNFRVFHRVGTKIFVHYLTILRMGSSISSMYSEIGPDLLDDASIKKNCVYHLAVKGLNKVIRHDLSYSHLLAITSCPDSIAPSLGQCLNQHYNGLLHSTHTIDIVQGCTGGVSALILASQLCEHQKGNVLIVTSDAAQKATSVSSNVYQVFKNGVFACTVSWSESNKGLIHHSTRQYENLYEVVTIGLGHDADSIIASYPEEIVADSRLYLGLKLNNQLALQLMKKAEGFYEEFIANTGHPDILILHQVNPVIIDHLQKVFSKYPVQFINRASETGNCGCATTGVLLDMVRDSIQGKKVMICSFGTGGIITAGLWQF